MVGTMHALSTSEVPCHSEGHSSSCIVKETMQKPPSFCVPWNIEAQPSFYKILERQGSNLHEGAIFRGQRLSSGFLASTVPPLSIEKEVLHLPLVVIFTFFLCGGILKGMRKQLPHSF